MTLSLLLWGIKMHFAHSTQNPDCSDWQVLADHLKNVAELAKSRGDKFGAAAAADLAGRLTEALCARYCGISSGRAQSV